MRFRLMCGLLSCFVLGCLLQLCQAAEHPALIPMPQQVQWRTGAFVLNNCKYIWLKDSRLVKEARWLQVNLWQRQHKKLSIVKKQPSGKSIALIISFVPAKFNPQEAYVLDVNTQAISLKANTPEGIFRGLQTLGQVITNSSIPACSITDYPAFNWRGYMVDVGRNYQSVALLKQQIEVMSRYKLNVFHLHLTEDVAWRLQIRKYPQLTAASNMQRNAGKFYTVADLQDLIAYCRERYITLVPEIDMPGHSAAFTRALGVGMQTEKGLATIKDILTEICRTYDVPYIHIGADEVRITNKQFLPQVNALLKQLHKQVIGWAPGGNYTDETIRQLWKDEGDKDIVNPAVRYIDSRSLYISDMDPLNTVVTIFERRLGDKPHGDSTMLGAEFCVWNDRKVNNEQELVSRNAVYPSIPSFGERSWCGGGYELAFNIGADTSLRAKAFAGFEQRLLAHKRIYFKNLPFNYVKQAGIKWKLIGPFDNTGNLSATFWPEQLHADFKSTPGLSATGGTVWLWHTGSPKVKAWLPGFKPNTTYYACTNFYSRRDTTLSFWIDFKDQSRSGADATPPAGAWDYKQSRLWVNGKPIASPHWQFPGRPKGLLEQPLVDESFYYRPPIRIKVKHGWNKVLVKLPMDNFDRKDWQVPPKWMFTFIPVQKNGINWETYPVRFDSQK